jgi:predicted kinase
MDQELIVLVGNIGTGKSLFASKYAKDGYLVINNDALVAMTNGGEYARYNLAHGKIHREMVERAVALALFSGNSVVIDKTNMSKAERKTWISAARRYDAKAVCVDFGQGDGDSLERRIKNDKGVTHDTWCRVHESMFERYEAPVVEEGFSRVIKAPPKFIFHAWDFDGTIVENKFPGIGGIIDEAYIKLCDIWRDKSNIIIIWTCRHGEPLNQMRNFLIHNKIPYDFINENPIVNYGSPKIFANIYYDDRNAP